MDNEHSQEQTRLERKRNKQAMRSRLEEGQEEEVILVSLSVLRL